MTSYDREIELDGNMGWASSKPVTLTDWLLGAVAVIGIAALVLAFLFL